MRIRCRAFSLHPTTSVHTTACSNPSKSASGLSLFAETARPLIRCYKHEENKFVFLSYIHVYCVTLALTFIKIQGSKKTWMSWTKLRHLVPSHTGSDKKCKLRKKAASTGISQYLYHVPFIVPHVVCNTLTVNALVSLVRDITWR